MIGNSKIMKLKIFVKSLFCLLLLISAINFSGCSSNSGVKVKLFNNYDRSVPPNLAVLDFKEAAAADEKSSIPFVVGLFLNPDAGPILAKIFSQEMANAELAAVIDRRTMVKKLKESGYENMLEIKGEDYEDVAKLLGADAIMCGEYKRFGFLYPTMIPRMVVKFSVEYYDLKSNSIVWRAKVKDQSSRDTDERDLARKRIQKVLKRLKRKLSQGWALPVEDGS